MIASTRNNATRSSLRKELRVPHITYFRMKAKPGERQAVIDSLNRWGEQRKSKATGFMRAVLTSNLSDPDEVRAAAMFNNKENYDANSNDPEQDNWFQELRSHLAGDPEWFDGKLEVLVDA